MKLSILLGTLALFSLFSSLDAHPTIYPDVHRNTSCYLPTPAKIYSYHIHLMYIHTNKQ